MSQNLKTHVRDNLDHLKGGLVVSCQARPGNPLHGASSMALMAQAAELGGARGLRINGPDDLVAVLALSSLPVMAINKVEHPDSPVMITPTVESARALLEVGATIVALDATRRSRPNGERLSDIVAEIHASDAVAMGDLATISDLETALAADIDAVGTTLSGYTGGVPVPEDPDFELLKRLVRDSPVPVFAEGRFWSPDQVLQAFDLGASFVVVGTAITNPMAITSRFVNAMSRRRS
jgi:N-acylglucosamine-6-phosphate 2-epimerase